MTGDVRNWTFGETAEIQKNLDTVNSQAKDLRKIIKDIELNGGKGGEEWEKYKAELRIRRSRSEAFAAIEGHEGGRDDHPPARATRQSAGQGNQKR